MNNSGSLFGIDPTQGFIEYIKTVKPYHTKLLDVLVEYVYNDNITASVDERWSWTYEFKRPETDTTYTCGYGYRWDATGIIAPEAWPSYNITQAVSNTPGQTANSFLIEFTEQPKHQIVVTDKRSNEIAFAARYPMVALNATGKTFSVAGDITQLDYFLYDDHIFVTDNSAVSVNTRYTVVSATFDGTNTNIVVSEAIPLIAAAGGNVNVVLPFDSIPYWPAGTSVKVTSSGQIPTPLNSAVDYFFIPSNRVGFFTLATVRYPQQFEQFVDIVSLGTGVIDIERTEPFVPGDPVVVKNSANAFNDGYYIIADIQREGTNTFRARVLQTVPHNSPVNATYDGKLMFDQRSYDFPSYCPMTRASDLHTYAFIHEDLKFTFEIFRTNTIATVVVENQPQPDTQTYFLPNTTIAANGEIMPNGYDVASFDAMAFDV